MGAATGPVDEIVGLMALLNAMKASLSGYGTELGDIQLRQGPRPADR
jgi:hypothetical protein